MPESSLSHVLIIDDREDLLRFCQRGLGCEFSFHRVASGVQAEAEFERGLQYELVLLDRDFSHAPVHELIGPTTDVRDEGLHILRRLRSIHPDLPILMVTGFRDQRVAMEAAELRADFLAWQDLVEHPKMLRARIERALEQSGTRSDAVLARFRALGVATESPRYSAALLDLYRAIPGVAPILLLGETGTGKDTLALAAHTLGSDGSRPYVSVNMAALNPGIVESELFGHARGAFTGASQATVGKLRYADGGTLFLNEVDELPLEAQAKLLTALETHEVVPVGDVKACPAHFRLITATSRDLRALVNAGKFRRDFYHRLAWHTITLPPLRERREDIPVLVRAFLHEAGQYGGVVAIAREALAYLAELPWEGNVRELRAVVEAAVALARYVVTLADVREVVRRTEWLSQPERSREIMDAASAVPPAEECVFGELSYREVTECYFRYLLRRSGGRLPEVARRAGIAKATVYEWRQRFDAESGEHPAP